MNKFVIPTALLVFAALAPAQDGGSFYQKLGLRIHGSAAQGFLYSSGNNYLTTKSSDGSAKWTEGSLNVGRTVTERFRVGAQVQSYSLGQLGRQNLMLDWAYGDYRVRSYFGIRAGKVKTPFGLYNELQDVDAVHPWALLPQALYPADERGFSLAHTGGVIYGEFSPAKQAGKFEYSVFGGSRSEPANDGFRLSMGATGIANVEGRGPMAGADLRWKAPLEGLTLGGAYARINLVSPHANAGGYPMRIDTHYQQQKLYAQLERSKLTLSGEWQLNPVRITVGPTPESYIPVRAWYAMASYRATVKLTVGTYYDQVWFIRNSQDRSDPGNHLKDVAISGRYDVNRYLYAKVEAHYMDGNSTGFYPQVNPNGYELTTRLLLARLGFAF